MFANEIAFTWERPTEPDTFVWEEREFLAQVDLEPSRRIVAVVAVGNRLSSSGTRGRSHFLD